MTRTAVINQKGGVGKTTTTVNLGAALARLGKKVLLIDLDPQSNMTLHLDRRPEEETRTVTSLFLDGAGLEGLLQETSTPGLYLLPADTSLAGVEQALANRIGRETLLREALEDYSGEPEFDCLLIDCPPSLGVLSANALVASDQVLIPVQAEYLALQGMAKLTEVIQLVQRRLNPSLEIACILPCMVDRRTNLAAEVLAEIRQHFGTLLANALIRANVKLAEAPSFGRTIFQHAPESNGARDYLRFAEEFLSRGQAQAPLEPEPEVEPQAVDAMAEPENVASQDAAAKPEAEPQAVDAMAEPENVVSQDAAAKPEVEPQAVDAMAEPENVANQDAAAKPEAEPQAVDAMAEPAASQQQPDIGSEPAPAAQPQSAEPTQAPPATADDRLAEETG
jgi:chromosome partitioning protein